MRGICCVEECTQVVSVRPYCYMHYRRLKAGDLRASDPPMVKYATPEEAIAARTEPRGDCIVWTGSVRGSGYGQIRFQGRPAVVHRVAWILSRGEIPDGKVVDHICHNKTCVNLAHLRLADWSQNGQNRAGADPRSTTGVRNVHAKGSKYEVRIKKNGVTHRFGIYESVEEAAMVAQAERVNLFGEFHGRA